MKVLIGALVGALSLFAADFTPLPASPEGASYARQHVLDRNSESGKMMQPRAVVTAADRILPGIMSNKLTRSTITLVNVNAWRASTNIYFIRYTGEDMPLPVIGNGEPRRPRYARALRAHRDRYRLQ